MGWWNYVYMYKVVHSQIRAIFCQLIQNMTTDCSFNYVFTVQYYLSSNCSHQSICSAKSCLKFEVLSTYYKHRFVVQCYGIFWANWWVNKYIWPSLTCTLLSFVQEVRVTTLSNSSLPDIGVLALFKWAKSYEVTKKLLGYAYKQ